MRRGIVVTLVVAGIVVSAGNLRAEEAAQSCDVPDSLLATDSSLNKAADAVKNGRPLDILVIGSRSSTIVSSDSSAYPARLQAALKEKLPQTTVNLSVEIQAKKTAEEMAGSLAKLV